MRRRKTLRLRGFDYSVAGFYRVTVCTHNRRCVLGRIKEETAVLSELGEIVSELGIGVDDFVVMPNHVHALLALAETCSGARARQASPLLGTVVASFKSGSTREINSLLGRRTRIWQRGYHDRIVRDEEELARIREYIASNPIRWALDPENPRNHVERL